ncbi:adenylate/guanylate cyclase domain-containing protein [Halorarius halobius]|uniref:adenylate/guanylate cyclase domain-containing protein n=1 Tax=Halorarius halobius TaxID=2962671 RepID=UPI0020CC6553|nr:adenylate/guanylate cyclase domain-containing protein [Halorarius halobius]
MSFSRGDVEERVEDRAENVEERLEDIPSSYSMPDLEDMTIGTAKEFRLGAVFLDIAGFTEYTSNQDDEDVLFMLNLFVPEVMELVRDYDGYFEKNTGDGILAYFGAGDDNTAIAHTVLEYIASVKTTLADYVNPTLEDFGIEPISIKAGASIGDVYISRIGVHSLNRRTAVGITANVASKLEDKADSNEYLVNHGINEYAHEGDSMWASHLTDEGSFSTYRWGSDANGWEDAHYYSFTGVWANTDCSNL